MYIKLRLEQSDPEFKYRHYIIQKFFSVDDQKEQEPSRHNYNVQKMDNDQQIDIQSRHFRIYYQKLNTKVLKFIKILTFNVIDDDISCIVESRSLSLEYLSLKKLKNVYEEFLKSFPTTLN